MHCSTSSEWLARALSRRRAQQTFVRARGALHVLTLAPFSSTPLIRIDMAAGNCCSCGTPKHGKVWLGIALGAVFVAFCLMIGGLAGNFFTIKYSISIVENQPPPTPPDTFSAEIKTRYFGTKIKQTVKTEALTLEAEADYSPRFEQLQPIHSFMLSCSVLAWVNVLAVLGLQALLTFSMFSGRWFLPQGPLRTLIIGVGLLSLIFAGVGLFNYALNLKYAFISMCQENGMVHGTVLPGLALLPQPTPSPSPFTPPSPPPAPSPPQPPPPARYCNSQLVLYRYFWGSSGRGFSSPALSTATTYDVYPGVGYICLAVGACILLLALGLNLCVSPNGCMCCIASKRPK